MAQQLVDAARAMRLEKRELERKIENLLLQFSDQTGLYVDLVKLEQSIDRRVVRYYVRAEIKIDHEIS